MKCFFCRKPSEILRCPDCKDSKTNISISGAGFYHTEKIRAERLNQIRTGS